MPDPLPTTSEIDPAHLAAVTMERNMLRGRLAELANAAEETFCDDAPCSRCDHLREAVQTARGALADV